MRSRLIINGAAMGLMREAIEFEQQEYVGC